MSSFRSKHELRKPTDRKKKMRRKREYSSSSSGSESDAWVEKQILPKSAPREDWMSMTGMLKTYTKHDIKPKRDVKERKNIDSYNPGTSGRELNPYWKNGGTGIPQQSDEIKQRKKLLKPSDDEDFYKKTSKHGSSEHRSHLDSHKERSHDRKSHISSGSWLKANRDKEKSEQKSHKEESYTRQEESLKRYNSDCDDMKPDSTDKNMEIKYVSIEKMNKLAAKIVKAEIMGDSKLAEKLKAKLEAVREYKRQNPDAGSEEDDGVLLTSTNAMGNSRPLTKSSQGDPHSKGGKKKSNTHQSGQRTKYFSNDDKYNLSELFEKEKYGNDYNEEAEFAKIASKHKNPNDDLEDVFMDEITKNKNASKSDLNDRERAIRQHVKMQRSMDDCEHCLSSKRMLKHLMVSCGQTAYLALPAQKSLVEGHCIISTIHHNPCVTALDEDVWEEIMDYRKALTIFFNSLDQDVVFFETATKLHKYPHMVINCIPMPRDVGDTAPIYFKKALLECEGEWAMNKKVIDLRGKNIRKGVPKGLSYFWVDFGMDPGFAHVIEDQRLFPQTFAEEIIGGILDLDHSLWKKPKRDQVEEQRKKVLNFIKKWKPFDTVKKRL